MPAAAQSPEAGKIGYDHLRRGPSLHVPVLIRKTDHGAGIRDIDVFRIGPGRIECNPKGQSKAGSEHLGALRLAVPADAPEHLHLARLALRHAQVTVGSGADLPRIVSVRLDLFDFE